MAKQLDWISLNAAGTESEATTLTFAYCVADSVEEKFKYTGVYTVPAPDPDEPLQQIWDEAVAAIKALEGIS